MLAKIRLESIASEPPVEIMQADGGPITIGRGPENHIVVDSDAVSRVHGSLLSTEAFWVFKDFESTNGSWVNGVKLTPGQLRIVRHGDVIQLADFPMRIREVAPRADKSGLNNPTLLVFYDDHFETEFSLAAPGAKFAIGGPAAQFFIQGIPGESPQLEIINNGWRLELTASGSRVPVIVNSMAATGIASLSDRDEIAVGPYRILINDVRSAAPGDPSLARPGAGTSPQARGGVQAYDRPHAPDHLRGPALENWESEAARRKAAGKKFVFGSNVDEDETTNTIGLGYQYPVGTGFEMSTSQRFSQAVFEAESRRPNPMTEMLLTIFGIVIFLVVVAVVVYFAVFMI